jgi:glycosyltransferase involved in cell wall biosynthesis
VGGVPALVRHEEHALVVPPGRPRELAGALERVLSDGALAERLGRAGHALVHDTYSLSALAGHYVDLYEELAGSAVRRRRRGCSTSA